MSPQYSIGSFWNRPGFYIGDADDLRDLVHFWNLRAAGIFLQFHDPRHADRTAHIRAEMMDQLRQVIPAPTGPSGVGVWYRGDRRVETELGIFGENPLRLETGTAAWNGFNVRAPTMQFDDEQVLASIGSNRGRSSISFSIPEKPFTDVDGSYGQHFVLSAYPIAAELENDRETLWTPFIPKLNEFYGRHLHFIGNCVRAEPESIGFISSVSDRSLTIRALNVTQLIAEIFASVGITARINKAGRIAETLIKQMGGLEGCRVFKIAGVRALIENHRPDQSFDRGAAASAILGRDTDHPLSRYANLYIEPRKPGTTLSKDAVLSFLLDKGVFRPGLKFDCPNCQLEFWRTLDDARLRLECEYCGNSFNTAPQLRDKAWAFRRSGLFGRDDNQEGAIPVILTLQQLTAVSRMNTKIFTSATSLEPNGAAIHPCETDFIIVGPIGEDRKTDIVIGECKTRMPITADDVANLRAVAEAFPPDSYNAFVVFARLTPFSQEEVELIKGINQSPDRNRAIMLTQRELEPYFVYEETAKEFDIRGTASSFAQMASTTDRVFFKEMRRQ